MEKLYFLSVRKVLSNEISFQADKVIEKAALQLSFEILDFSSLSSDL